MKTASPDLTALELDQRSDVLATPLPKKKLKGWTIFLLSFLRVYVVLSVALVILAFVRALR